MWSPSRHLSKINNNTMDMLAIGNDDLNKLPLIVKKGDVVIHTNEDGTTEEVTIMYGKTNGVENSAIGFFTTSSGKTYIASIEGKLLPGLRLKQVSTPN